MMLLHSFQKLLYFMHIQHTTLLANKVQTHSQWPDHLTSSQSQDPFLTHFVLKAVMAYLWHAGIQQCRAGEHVKYVHSLNSV